MQKQEKQYQKLYVKVERELGKLPSSVLCFQSKEQEARILGWLASRRIGAYESIFSLCSDPHFFDWLQNHFILRKEPAKHLLLIDGRSPHCSEMF